MAKKSYEAERRILQALLVQIRQEAGMRQVDVARKLRRRQTFVSKYEHGKHRLDLSELRHICEIVGISPSDFFDRYEAAVKEEHQPDDAGKRRRVKRPKGHRR